MAGQRLTLALVRKELLQGPLATDPGADAEAVAAALCALSIVRLSWLNLGPRLSSLDVLMGGRLKELHLQHNSLSAIGDGLELLGGTLEFLSLSHNRLRAVEGLGELRQLKVLDLSDNWIDALDADELPPRNLRILELHGNPCMTRVAAAAGGGGGGGAVGAAACRAACAARCPQLIELDQDPVERGAAAGGEAEGTGGGSSSSSSSTGVAAVAQHEYVREATDALWAVVLGEEATAKAEAVAFGQPHGPGADDDDGGGAATTVGKEAYRALHCRMYWALVGPAGGADDADVDAAFGEDWLRDVGVADAQLLAAGGGSGDPAAAQAQAQAATTADAKLRMTRAAFGGAMLDTAAHFCGAEGDGGERHDPVRVAAFLRQLLRDIAATDAAPVRWRPVAEIKGLFVGSSSSAVRAADATTVEGGGGGGAEDDDAEDAAMRAMEAELRQARDEAITAAESRLEGADLEEVQAMRAKLAAGRRDRAEALAAAQADGMARIELAAGQLRGKLGEMGARRAARSKALESSAAETDQRIAALGERNSHK